MRAFTRIRSASFAPALSAAGLMALVSGASAGQYTGTPTESWRYYRPGNTGIQGDYCDAIWIGPDNDPWIGGYSPSFEEGGLAKFVQSENRWINISNIDYPEIGHPEETGITRVRDITQDAEGNLWMGTGRGVLVFNPDIGPSSLRRFGASNSPWQGGWLTNVELAPDGTFWFGGYSTVWGFGGLFRYDPATDVWTDMGASRGENIAVQPKPGGGYVVWVSRDFGGATSRFDSTTQTWTELPQTPGNPVGVIANKPVDQAGNVWMLRLQPDGFTRVVDCRRPDGTWVGVTPPPGTDAFRALGPLEALAVDGNGGVWYFDGSDWLSRGTWRPGGFSTDVNIDDNGVIWACGNGGAARRDPATGQWQRYRVTNTAQYDSFNNDLTIDPNGGIYACANAGPGFGGMVRFDGERWIGFNNHHYGLGVDWPFPTDNSKSVYVRPSNGDVVVNPMFNATHSFDGSAWTEIPGGSSSVIAYTEDSLDRLWGLGEYISLGIYQGGVFDNVSISSWGQEIRPDPDRPGTVWAQAGYMVKRTDGAYTFSRTIDDFPELNSQSDTFSGLAVEPGGVAWLGSTILLRGSGGLIRLDAESGTYSMMTYEGGWPLPGKFVSPLAATPDGRLWMKYDTDYFTAQRGLCWYDGTNTGVFPAPPGGEPQWGGLPHAQIDDCEVRLIPNGYELWMSCKSRGIAVLSVVYPSACVADTNGDGVLSPADFNSWIVAFNNNAPECDQNGDGQCTPADFNSWVVNFNAGC